jgi:membrane protein implicated in regulation of membrane protease activity
VFAPGAFFLWLGIAAGVVGLLVFLAPTIGWEYQILLFSVLSVISIIIWRRFFRLRAEDTDQPALNRRGEQYIGRIFTLAEPIVNGNGKIRVDDSTWKIEGEDCEAGTRIRVTGVDGTILRVAKEN